MENQSHLLDYSKALAVLSSCETREHIACADKYFRLFIKKWKHLLSDRVINDMVVDFHLDLTLKLQQII
jgi:aminoglycoside phosphotransferase family enzyme